jgi:hypothetical protein
MPLHVGDYVQLRLFFPDQARPMDVSLAAVRCIHGKKIGVEFIRSSKDDQVRLATLVRGQLLSTDIRRSGERDHRATPCYRPLITLRH